MVTGVSSSGSQKPDSIPAGEKSAHASRFKKLFLILDANKDGFVTYEEILQFVAPLGIHESDSFFKTQFHVFREHPPQGLDLSAFCEAMLHANEGVERIFNKELAISNFPAFTEELVNIYNQVQLNEKGKVADYIPQLARVPPEKFGMAVCSIDGQRFAHGDCEDSFSVQSCCKPITYCMAVEELGLEKVHEHVGREPSGRGFNAFVLNHHGLPHNPMINSGAIMTTALLDREKSSADRFDNILDTWRELTGSRSIGFDNPTYLSEKSTADRNYALGHFMRESGAFPLKTDLHEVIDLYFQICSITLNTRAMATLAGTLANGGICPITGHRVFKPETVRSCLSLMYSCGMYDFSGEFAFQFGLPAKSGISGVLMVIIPKKMGLCVWSPKLDRLGNSVRGLDFCSKLNKQFGYHIFDQLVPGLLVQDHKSDKSGVSKDELLAITDLCFAAAAGDLPYIKILAAKGIDLSKGDYDGRTALHLACAEGHMHVVKYLAEQGADTAVVDRFGTTPAMEAKRCNYIKVAEFLNDFKVI